MDDVMDDCMTYRFLSLCNAHFEKIPYKKGTTIKKRLKLVPAT